MESVSREIDEIKLSPSHQRERGTMHYSPVNNEKNHVRHHMNMRPLDNRKLRMFCISDFLEINKICQVFLYEVRFVFSFL